MAPHRVVTDIGGGQPVELMAFIEEIEAALGKKAIRNYMEFQPGDIQKTEAGLGGAARRADRLRAGDTRADGRARIRALVPRLLQNVIVRATV